MKSKILGLFLVIVAGQPAWSSCAALAFNPHTHSWGRAKRDSLSDAMNAAANVCDDGCGIYNWTCDSKVIAIVFNSDGSWANSKGDSATDAVNNAQLLCPSCDGYVTVGNR